ncbi:MAG: hypothetical protein ACK4LB_07400 [Spirosomataceae bacterium]
MINTLLNFGIIGIALGISVYYWYKRIRKNFKSDSACGQDACGCG